MKKTLAALAVLGAFAGSAAAAEVTLYGVADLGLHYSYSKVDNSNPQIKNEKSKQSLVMASGQNSGSRFGLKGTEDLGNGMTVGFILENGFSADDGKLGQSDRLFGREANLFLKGDFGTLSAGRVGALSSGLGSYNIMYQYTAFGTGWGDHGMAKGDFMLADRDRFDNTLTYVSPTFGGVTVYAQYSFEADGKEVEKTNQNKRYAGIGARYQNGAFATSLVVDSIMNKSAAIKTVTNHEDSLGVSFGASYDFGVAQVFGMAQYGKNENKLGGYTIATIDADGERDKGDIDVDNGLKGVTGYALEAGVKAPAFGGTAYFQANYTDGETEVDSKVEFSRWGLGAGYAYPLSKRTMVYGYGAYNEGELTQGDKVKTKLGELGFGLVHKF